MTVPLPSPVPLDPPDSSPEAVAEVGASVAGAAFHLGVLAAHLAGPAGSAPDWLGRDAAAAAAQIGRVLDLAGTARTALGEAAGRLATHARLVEDVRARIAALRRQQEEDFAATLARLEPGPSPLATDPLGSVLIAAHAVVGELRAAEQDRARAHAALLAEVAEDAAATARVLGAAAAAVGGAGRRGDADRVVVHLAGLLPGWGEEELGARGARLAGSFTAGPIDGAALQRASSDALPFAGSPAFAAGFVGGLGADGVRWLLTWIGQGGVLAGGGLVRLLAGVLDTEPPAEGTDVVGRLLTRVRVDPRDRDPWQDVVAIGMGEVLAAASTGPGGSRRRELLADWGTQVLRREGTLQRRSPDDCRADTRVAGLRAGPVPDPVETVVELLGQRGDPVAATAVLSSREAWSAVLARPWPDGGAALAAAVTLLGRAPGAGGRRRR